VHGRLPAAVLILCASLFGQAAFEDFLLPAPSAIRDLAPGSDGNVWFTGSSRIGKITPAGVILEYPLPSGFFTPKMTPGPDGNIWFSSSGEVAKISTSGVVTTVLSATPGWVTQDLAFDGGGNLWLVDYINNQVGELTTKGEFKKFAVPINGKNPATGQAMSGLRAICLGADGNMWFTENLGKRVARITPAGVITEFGSGDSPDQIVLGSDGNVWFTEQSTIGRMTPAGSLTEWHMPSQGESPVNITRGPDGAIWIAALWIIDPGNQGNRVMRMSPAGAFTELTIATGALSSIDAMVAGPDGNIWLSERKSDTLVKVIAPPAVTPASLTFAYQIGDIAPLRRSLQISKPGVPVPFHASADAPWLTVSPELGATPGSLSVAVSPAGLAPGLHQGTITIDAGSPILTGTVTVDLTVTAEPQLPRITGVVNAASFSSGPIAPGEIISVAGAYLGPVEALGPVVTSDGRIATQSGGVSVKIGGYLAPLIYAGANQINCIVPYELGVGASTLIQVFYGANTSNAFSLEVAAAAPAAFTLDGARPIVLNAEGGLNAPDNPASAGSIVVLYLTGEGQTAPPSVTGAVTVANLSGSPLTPEPVLPLRVSMGGVAAKLLFAGETPGAVAGLLQINALVPAGSPPGEFPLTISLGGFSAQRGMSIFVK
jgi:uncharacterized protein (TIGR03437 family)